MPIVVVVDAVVEKIHQIRNNCLGPLLLQEIDQVIVRQGHILYEDFADDTDARFAQGLVDGEMVKTLNNLPAECSVALTAFTLERSNTACPEFGMQRIRRAGNALIGTDSIQAAKKKVAEDDGFAGRKDHRRGKPEPFVLLHAVGVQGDNGDMRETGLVKGTANETHIVAGPAASTGLRHDDGEAVSVIVSGENGLHDLAHNRHGRKAGVVVNISESGVDGGAVVVGEHHHVVPMAAENGFQQVKVNRTHLWCKNGVAPAPHPIGEFCPVIGHLLRMRDDVFFLPHVHGGQQAADPDPRRAKVVDLVDLQDGVQLPAVFKNLADLVCGDGVQPTAKRVELNQFKILMAGDEFGSGIETGMIHPLIRDAHRTFGIKVDGETVLGEDREPEPCDHLRNAVVDLGIDVIRTAGENNAAAVRGLHFF